MTEDNKAIDDFSDADKVSSDMNFWDYKNVPNLIGVFDRFEKDAYGEHVVLIAEDGEVHLPNLTALNSKLKSAHKGDKVKAVNLGEKKSEKSGRMYYDFDIFIKRTPAIPEETIKTE